MPLDIANPRRNCKLNLQLRYIVSWSLRCFVLLSVARETPRLVFGRALLLVLPTRAHRLLPCHGPGYGRGRCPP